MRAARLPFMLRTQPPFASLRGLFQPLASARSAMTQPTESRRRGPRPKPAAEKRSHQTNVWLNAAELEWVDAERAKRDMQRGPFLRESAMRRLPPSIPAINREAWAALARSAANLNQIAKAINRSGSTSAATKGLSKLLRENIAQLSSVRADLMKGSEE